MSQRDEREYLLGTNEAELIRLGLQHRLWSAQAFACWDAAGFQPGHAILDVGCGPGYATFDLAQLVGPGGRVVGFDVSARFIAYLDGEVQRRGVTNVESRLGDVATVGLPAGAFDGAYARWVLCFVPDPAAIIAAVARALRPGGVFAVQDYYNYEAVRLSPRSAAFERAIAATGQSWRDGGGDPEFGCRLPALLAAHGLRPRLIRPLLRVARPGEPLWQWPTTFFRNFVPSLVAKGYLTPADRAAFDADWQARTADRDAFLMTPPMLEVVAVRE